MIALVFTAILLAIQGLGGARSVQAGSTCSQSFSAAAGWEYQLDFSATTPVSASRQAGSVSLGLRLQGASAYLQSSGGNQYRLNMAGSE